MSATTEIKDAAKGIIEALKQLPKDKQEYVSGYVQGVADAAKELSKQQSKSA